MKLFILIFILSYNFVSAQNNIRIVSLTGELFKVTAFNKVQNKIPQSSVLIEAIFEDTIHLIIELEAKITFEASAFLLEKGMPTKNKEFNYQINFDNNKPKLNYSACYDIVKLPNPLVPNKPKVDTNVNFKNNQFAHFCELKDGQPIYFNNIPKDGKCIIEMPTAYLNYIHLLMLKAQVADDKYTIAENIVRNNCYTCDQLNLIVNYIDYELDKLKLIKLAYMNVTDKANKKNLETAFRFEASILALNEFLKTADNWSSLPGNTCEIPSADEDILALKTKLIVYSNDTQRYEALKKLYSTYCYSTAQIKLILNTFIHDREKLDAAKMLYFYCIEKKDFSSITEIFSYNETVSELNDFIKKQNE